MSASRRHILCGIRSVVKDHPSNLLRGRPGELTPAPAVWLETHSPLPPRFTEATTGNPATAPSLIRSAVVPVPIADEAVAVALRPRFAQSSHFQKISSRFTNACCHAPAPPCDVYSAIVRDLRFVAGEVACMAAGTSTLSTSLQASGVSDKPGGAEKGCVGVNDGIGQWLFGSHGHGSCTMAS